MPAASTATVTPFAPTPYSPTPFAPTPDSPGLTPDSPGLTTEEGTLRMRVKLEAAGEEEKKKQKKKKKKGRTEELTGIAALLMAEMVGEEEEEEEERQEERAELPRTSRAGGRHGSRLSPAATAAVDSTESSDDGHGSFSSSAARSLLRRLKFTGPPSAASRTVTPEVIALESHGFARTLGPPSAHAKAALRRKLTSSSRPMLRAPMVEVRAAQLIQRVFRGFIARRAVYRTRELRVWAELAQIRKQLRLLSYACCGLFASTFLYLNLVFGLRFTPEQSSGWIGSSVISLFVDIFVRQPVVIVIKAMLLYSIGR
eukprot:PLAT3337.3.p1 GENE.PLAT3337.3~~PLAT3337.3.p1  ORF type:complete len:353 (-),score=81.52 PLAT3337.3:245-1186(-)